jgi:hypothetical protein
MRNLPARIISSFALVTLLAGSALAAGSTSSSHPQPTVSNGALQDQLERDANDSNPRMQRSPLGQVVVPGDAMQPAAGSGQVMNRDDDMSAKQNGPMHLSRDD